MNGCRQEDVGRRRILREETQWVAMHDAIDAGDMCASESAQVSPSLVSVTRQ